MTCFIVFDVSNFHEQSVDFNFQFAVQENDSDHSVARVIQLINIKDKQCFVTCSNID